MNLELLRLNFIPNVMRRVKLLVTAWTFYYIFKTNKKTQN